MLPTTIERMPPSFLFKAQSEAPQNTGWISLGKRPARHKLENCVRSVSSLLPASPVDAHVKSFKCCGRRPSGPPADPGMKDLIAPRMSDSSTEIQFSLEGGSGVEPVFAQIGCFSRNTAAVMSSENLEKCINRSSLKLVSTCSSLIIKFDASLFFVQLNMSFCLQPLEGFECPCELCKLSSISTTLTEILYFFER